MKVLKDYPKELVELLWPSLNLLSKANIRVFSENDGIINNYWRFLFLVPCVILQYTAMGLYLIKIAAQGEIAMNAIILPPFIISTHGFLKGVLLFPKRSFISTVIKEFGDLWRTTGLNKVQKKQRTAQLRKVNFVIKGTTWMSLIGGYLYLLTPILETLFRRHILGQECVLKLPLEGSYGFNPNDNWLVYLAMYILQFSYIFICIYLFVGSDFLMIALCALLGIEFTLLCEDMVNVKPDLKKIDNIDVMDCIEECTICDFVKRHQRLCELSNQLDEAFNQLVCINLLFPGISTCCYVFSGHLTHGFIYLLINRLGNIICFLFVFYMCYYGQLISDASLRVGDVAYQSLWYKGDIQFQKIIYIIIIRSQKPCHITSLKYSKITLNTFTQVISTAWSYLSLMNSIYEDEFN